AFATAMNAANSQSKPLEGIIFVTVDANVAGTRALLTSSTSGSGTKIPGGINVKGTLAFHLVNAPDDHYRLSIETPLKVNAATLSASFNPSDPSTFKTAYPPVYSTSAVDPHGYTGFKKRDDLPAVMADAGTP